MMEPRGCIVPISGIFLVLFILCTVAFAHDHARPELNEWFNGLRAKGVNGDASGAVCCDGTEAKRLEDVDWESRDGHYRVRMEGQWYDVPDAAVVEGPNRAGPTMVWPLMSTWGAIAGVRCFMPGPMT